MNTRSDNAVPDLQACVHCNEPVGVYERAVWVVDDGRVVIASPLGVDARDLRPSVAAHLHFDCWNKLIGQSRNDSGGGGS